MGTERQIQCPDPKYSCVSTTQVLGEALKTGLHMTTLSSDPISDTWAMGNDSVFFFGKPCYSHTVKH